MTEKPSDTTEESIEKICPLPSPAERAAIEAARQRVRARAPRVTINISNVDGGNVDINGGGHSDHEGWLARLEDAFGTHGRSFAISALNQLMTAARDGNGKIDGARVNAMLAVVESTRPENELQASLAVQMAATHFASMTLLRRTMSAEQITQFDSAGNMAVKLLRTFVLQAEALAKLQRGGEQIVKVVHIHSGGQAIVGNVSTGANGAASAGGGVADENRNQPHAKAIEAAAGPPAMPPMWGQDAEREPVPVTRGEG